jgi:hypothetical protein
MAKRQKLTMDTEELTNQLKSSAGRGVDAFFTPSVSPPFPTLQTSPSIEPNRDINSNRSREVGKEVNREVGREVSLTPYL